jgi:hypothetical protein
MANDIHEPGMKRCKMCAANGCMNRYPVIKLGEEIIGGLNEPIETHQDSRYSPAKRIAWC